jgi:hypothetical protein
MLARSDYTNGAGEKELTMRVLGGGVSLEAIAGVGALVLAILSLLDVAARELAAVAVIAAGAGFLIRGTAMVSRVRAILDRDHPEETSVVSGLSIELLAGAAGIALGVLAFLDVEPEILLASAVIAFGAALVLGAPMTKAVDQAIGGLARVTSAAVDAELGFVAIIGAGAVTRGILALIGVAEPMTLIAIALSDEMPPMTEPSACRL